MMIEIDTKKPVLVTGGSGYLASWVVQKLLQQGHKVHTTVRDKNKPQSVQHFSEMENADTHLTIFSADLLKDGSFSESMQGCEVVIHTASPFVFMNITDPQEQLIKPAVQGTENVLNSASETPTVKRIVLTSSIASMYGDNIDCTKNNTPIIDESCWNTSSSVTHQPYSYSKVMAEKRAWEIADAQSQWQLVTINPAMIFGPSLVEGSQSFSIDLLKQIGDGRLWPAVPNLPFAAVDVRDVAQAHIEASFAPSAEGRYLIAERVTNFLELAKALSNKYKRAFKFPFFTAPKFMVWLLAPIYGLKRNYIDCNANYDIAINNSKSQALNFSYTNIESTVIEHYQQLLNRNEV